MSTSYEDKITQQAAPYLEPGERVLAAFITQPRGATTARAGGLAPGAIGAAKVRRNQRSAAGSGLRLVSPMALALTNARVLVLSVSQPIALGKGGDVKELVSAVALDDVEAIEVKRLLIGKVVTLTVGGSAIKLEAGAGANARGLADEFARVKAGALAPRRA
jgi:hypothetical protein